MRRVHVRTLDVLSQVPVPGRSDDDSVIVLVQLQRRRGLFGRWSSLLAGWLVALPPFTTT